MLKGFFLTWSNSVFIEVEAQAWDNTTVRNTSSAEAQPVPEPLEGYTHTQTLLTSLGVRENHCRFLTHGTGCVGTAG